jgi:hypothetical protein
MNTTIPLKKTNPTFSGYFEELVLHIQSNMY